jgi:hypothetical protein
LQLYRVNPDLRVRIGGVHADAGDGVDLGYCPCPIIRRINGEIDRVQFNGSIGEGADAEIVVARPDLEARTHASR